MATRRTATRSELRKAIAFLKDDVRTVRNAMFAALMEQDTEANERKVSNAIAHIDEALHHLDKSQLALK